MTSSDPDGRLRADEIEQLAAPLRPWSLLARSRRGRRPRHRQSETADQALLAPVQLDLALVLVLDGLAQHGRAETSDCRGVHRRSAILLPYQVELIAALVRLDARRERDEAGRTGKRAVLGGVGGQLIEPESQCQREIRIELQVFDIQSDAVAIAQVWLQDGVDERW